MAMKLNPKKKPPITYFLIITIPAAIFLIFLLSIFQFSGTKIPIYYSVQNWSEKSNFCNYSDGFWVKNQDPPPLRYDNSCKEIFKGWNCISAGKPNAREISIWRWKPKKCDILPLNPSHFLNRFKNKKIGFVGDSLNRNMFVSLVCMLKGAASGEVKKFRPAKADRGFIFIKYNLTVAYHRTNLLVRYGRWSFNDKEGKLESLGYKQGYRVDIDVPDRSWAEAPMYHDILVFNSGHWWWAPSKFDAVEKPMLFFQGGKPILPVPSPKDGFSLALKHMVAYVDRTAQHKIKIFRTQSPRHFEGGDWFEGGSCTRTEPLSPGQVEEMFAVRRNGTNVEARVVNSHILRALEGSEFRVLHVTHLSEFRADGHPGTAGGKVHDDCMHWCLPGVTDTWNDLLSHILDST